ncbi:MAG: hypothetical protein HXX11_13280 [Desulfuromonadales bacterium]|nr:hypothetical protein [Desulfuromonadales bacterium]
MKIYLFNPDSGVYLGEDFADEAPMKRGTFVIPPDATTIAPPRIESGQVLVFNARIQQWEVHHRPCTDFAKAAHSQRFLYSTGDES